MYNVKKNIERLKRGDYTYFLDPLEAKLVAKSFKKEEYNILKPYEDSEKVIFYKKRKPNIILFKIISISKEKFRHQDILGSIFSLNITKEMFGDIIIDNNNYYFYILEIMRDYFLINFTKIKKYDIALEEINIATLQNYQRKYLELELKVKSERLDTVVACLSKTSRSKVKEKFQNKEIILNYNIAVKESYYLKEEDVFSIKGLGKFKYEGKIKKTKKDNYIIKVFKYL